MFGCTQPIHNILAVIYGFTLSIHAALSENIILLRMDYGSIDAVISFVFGKIITAGSHRVKVLSEYMLRR